VKPGVGFGRNQLQAYLYSESVLWGMISFEQASAGWLSFLSSVPGADVPAIQNWSRDFTEEVSYSDSRSIGIDSTGHGGRIGIGFEGPSLAIAQLASDVVTYLVHGCAPMVV